MTESYWADSKKTTVPAHCFFIAVRGGAMCEFCEAKANTASRGRENFSSEKLLVTTHTTRTDPVSFEPHTKYLVMCGDCKLDA